MADLNKIHDFLEEYLQRKGIDTKKLFRCVSPTHEDKTPSMTYYKKEKKCTCFGCGAKYDIFKLVGMEYNLKSFKEQLNKLEEFIKNPELIEDANKTIYSKKNITEELYIQKSFKENNNSEEININNPKDVERVIKYQNYIKYCLLNADKSDYLQKRGISKEIQKKFNVGYDPKFGDKISWNNGAIIIPTNYLCFTARNVDINSNDRLRKIGSAQIFQYDRINEYKNEKIYIVEGEIDALSLAEAGQKAIALGSVKEIDLLVKKLKEDKFDNKFLIMLDNDESGRKAQEELYFKMKNIGMKVEKTNLLDKYKDPNEFLVKDRNKFLCLFEDKEIKKEWIEIATRRFKNLGRDI